MKNNRRIHSFNIALTILLIFLVIYIVKQEYYEFYYVISIFRGTFSIALGILTLLKGLKSYYRYIGIGFLFIGIMEYIKVIILKIDNLQIVNDIYIPTLLTNNTLEILIIILTFVLANKKLSLKISLIVYGGVTLGVFLLYYNFNTIISYDKVKGLYSIGENFIVPVTMIFLIIITVKILNNRRDIDKSFNFKYIMYYLIFIILYQICFNLCIYSKINLGFESEVLKYIAYFVMYEGITKHILSTVYDDMKYKLKESEKIQAELNIKLNQRNIILKELEGINKKSEKRYCNLIESFKDGVLIFNRNRIAYINNEALKMLGLDYKEEVFGQGFNFLTHKLMRPDDLEKYNLRHKQLISVLVLNENKRYKFKSNIQKDRELELYIIKSNSFREIVYIKDMTHINSYNDMRLKYEEYLKEESIKNEFYSNISHELRTPINVINSALTLNEIYLKDNSIESIIKNNETIKQNCLRLIRTINNFIDANKISEGYLKANKKIYNIVEVVENVTIATNKYVKKINNLLIFDSSHEEIYIPCDRDMIERVMLNLLSNSVKYGEKDRHILVNLNLEKSFVYISVENYSKKIQKDEEAYLFDEFTKINKSLNREKEGSGLGLYLSRAVIELHGGSIELEETNSKRNKFIIKIPIEEELDKYDKGDNVEIISLEKKVDGEFSDIYL